jgi:hypothetical protein
MNRMPHTWRFHGWAAMPTGSGDLADVKLWFSGLTDKNRTAFAIGVAVQVCRHWNDVTEMRRFAVTDEHARESYQRPTRETAMGGHPGPG